VLKLSLNRWLLILALPLLVVANFWLRSDLRLERQVGEPWLVNRVISGQTIEASPINNPTAVVQRIRLIGISAPLKEQIPWGDRARQRLEALVKEQQVTLEFGIKQKDSSDRLLAYVWKDNRLINLQLVEEGFVLADPFIANVKYDAQLSRGQTIARLMELGIWEPRNPLRLSPKDFRRQLSK
jgi:micrococcal nuclease